MPSHLPLLLNPLLNAIFNNPHPDKSQLKDVYAKLNKSFDDSTVIVVPPLDTLLNYYDRDTELAYSDLCYAEEFLKDHIIVTQETRDARLFTTLSGKEVLVRRDTVFTGKGFKKSLQLKATRCEYFQNFNDYFPKGKRFMVMHVTRPLFGEPVKTPVIAVVSPSSNRVDKVYLHDHEEETTRQETVKTLTEAPPATEEIPVRFEQLMRTYPLISKNVGEDYETLFRSFSVREVPEKESLSDAFMKAIEDASHIFQTLSDDIVSSIIDTHPYIDLNECVYNYVELNLFDKIWNKLCDLNEDFLAGHYEELGHLSLNQVSLPDANKIDLTTQSVLEKKVAKAVAEFKKLELTTDAASKIKVFVDTISLLSSIDSMTIDADTLVGLLLIVVVHAAVPNLENHLFYVQNFSFQNIDIGLTGYALSTFEGVLLYLKDEESIEPLKKYSRANRQVFAYIDEKELLELKKLADHFSGEADSALKSRTKNGDSLLMQAIQSNDYDTWKLLIDYEELFPLEDLLHDRNISDMSLLNAALNCENFDMIDELTEILLSSCTRAELRDYLNFQDQHHRTVGHYLFHYRELIPKVGAYIDWTLKDMNGQTPLFALCRSYDCPDYPALIDTVFEVVEKWYSDNNSEFDYADHIDSRGNTLLHIMNSQLDVLLKYDRLNVNEINKKGFTALMIYAKYNRLENIKTIVDHPALVIDKVDRHFFTCLDQAKNPVVSDIIEAHYLDQKLEPVSGKQVGVMRVKLEDGIWKLLIRAMKDGKKYETLQEFSHFRQLIKLIEKEFPNTFIPLEHTLKHFDMLLNFSAFNKLKLNKIVDHLNIALQCFLLNKQIFEFEKFWSALLNLESDGESQAQTNGHSNGDTKGVRHEKDEFFLQPEEISEINFFLKFSLKELTKLKFTYDKLFKIVSFQTRKAFEFNEAETLFNEEELDQSEELRFVANLFQDQSKEFVLDSDLCDMVLYLCLANDEIIKMASNLINHKIYKWWKLYGELIELNNSYKKFKQVELKKSNANLEDEVQGLVEVNEERFEELSTSTSFNTLNTKKKKTKKPQPSFLSTFIESKRHKYEAKLLESLKMVKEGLVELNKDIKKNHETLAMEINNFLNFKADLMQLVLKKYAKKQIRDLKYQIMTLSRGLRDVQALK